MKPNGNDGKEISIILICSERRNFGSNILNKLFSIGIYNALIGNDRSMDNLCRLINRPRTKKEAKIYYRIDQAAYEAATDNGEVSETEIQNILNHFKKLGKSTDRYTDSFNNIAAQYTDEQLKLIVNVLPIKVKAVLEAESEKYQSLMGTTGENRSAVRREPGISVNTIGSGKEQNISGPIVIPSGVKKFSGGIRPIVPSNTASTPQQRPSPVKQKAIAQATQNRGEQVATQSTQQVPVRPQPQAQPQARPQVQARSQVQPQARSQVQAQPQVQQQVRPQAQTMQQQNVPSSQVPTSNTQSIVHENNTGKRYTGTIAQVKRTLIARRITNTNTVPVQESANIENDITEDMILEEGKRGRGRPKKIVENEQDLKPKGKRGRPRKNDIEDSMDDLLGNIGSQPQEEILPGLEENEVLPGLEENDVLPGLEENDEEEATMLPGMGFDEELEENEDEILPGLDDNDEGEEVDVNSLLAGLDDNDKTVLPDEEDEEGILPGLEDDSSEILDGFDMAEEEETLPGLEDTYTDTYGASYEDDGIISEIDTIDTDNGLPGVEEPDSDEMIFPEMGVEDNSFEQENIPETNSIESIKPQIDYSMSNLNSLLSKDKKIVAFVGATKNGTSFLINNLALMFSMMGIDTAILDMTQNKNSYYLYTDSKEELRKIAYTSLSKLENGYADGIKFNKNLTVYTGLPSDGSVFENAEPILSTLVQNHSLVLIDTDFETPPAYFASSQEIYLVQSMDILTIQPLTAFLRDLKFKGAWEPEKARVVINKEVSIRGLTSKAIIGGMSRYNGPDMSVMTELFNKDMVKACSIPFDEKVYSKYLETLATCKLSIGSLPKQFRAKLQILGEMVYPRLNSKTSYNPSPDMGDSGYNPRRKCFFK